MGKQNNKKIDKVSVVTTFYNAEKFIIQAVSSVNQQLINGFELEYVIVDDKSPCNSRKMVEQFVKTQGNKKIDFKIVEPDENLGCGGARKFGIDNSTGDYLMFVDSDDLLTPESINYKNTELITFNNGILKHDFPKYIGNWIENDYSNDRNVYKEQFNFLEDFDQFQSFKNYYVVERLKGLHIEEDELKIQDLLKIDIQDKERETFNILTFDENYRINDYQNVTVGGISTTIAEPKALMKYILNPKNKGFAVTHNHPSDIPLPSEADISITDRLHELGKSLGTPLYEHYIVGKAGVQTVSHFHDLMLTYDKRDIQMKAAENLRKERESNERGL